MRRDGPSRFGRAAGPMVSATDGPGAMAEPLCYFLFGSILLPITPPTAAPPTVPAVPPPVRMAPAAPPITAPVAVFLSRVDMPLQAARDKTTEQASKAVPVELIKRVFMNHSLIDTNIGRHGRCAGLRLWPCLFVTKSWSFVCATAHTGNGWLLNAWRQKRAVQTREPRRLGFVTPSSHPQQNQGLSLWVRPTMRLIRVKSIEQQSMLCVHRLSEG